MVRSTKRRTVELPTEIHERLKQEAARQGLTLSTALIISVREWLERQPRRDH